MEKNALNKHVFLFSSLTALMNEGKFFGMYEYMFQKGVYVNCVGAFHVKVRCRFCMTINAWENMRVIPLGHTMVMGIPLGHTMGPQYH
jgi:hypothetical protein